MAQDLMEDDNPSLELCRLYIKVFRLCAKTKPLTSNVLLKIHMIASYGKLPTHSGKVTKSSLRRDTDIILYNLHLGPLG
jgi:DNA-binding XRE family transcriptional regulator